MSTTLAIVFFVLYLTGMARTWYDVSRKHFTDIWKIRLGMGLCALLLIPSILPDVGLTICLVGLLFGMNAGLAFMWRPSTLDSRPPV